MALVGAFAFAMLALSRGEHVNAVWLVVAAVACYSIAYRFYSRFIADKVFELDDRRLTPAERHNDGLDYVPTNKWVLFGHHFAAIAARRAAGGADSGRADGLPAGNHLDPGRRYAGRRGAGFPSAVHLHTPRRTFAGEMAKQELGAFAGVITMLGALGVMIIILSALALVVVKPWPTARGAVHHRRHHPDRPVHGIYMRFIRPQDR